jgi:ABC-2 type transport system ATP-binding protein
MLAAEALSKAYGNVDALTDLNLKVEQGEIFCLLGANGAGKTTTIQLMMGFIKPSSGKVLIDGKDVSRHTKWVRQNLAYIPEHVNLYNNLSGIENLSYFSALSGRKYNQSDLTNLLEKAGLPGDAQGRYVGQYSKGMRQKVGIAIALAKKAKGLLLDEPTSGLDPEAANGFAQLLLQLKAEGMAILMASHDLFRCRETGDRVGIMKRGRLLEVRDAKGLSAAALEQLYIDLMRLDETPQVIG